MRSIATIEEWIEQWSPESVAASGAAAPGELLRAAEAVLENWLSAHGKVPTDGTHEGFRLIALHRQAAVGDPSFNACRETCREAAYRFNLAATEMTPQAWRANLATLRRVVQHLVYFVGGKLRNSQLGEFCCASRPIRTETGATIELGEELT
jgi:hypothetical protein